MRIRARSSLLTVLMSKASFSEACEVSSFRKDAVTRNGECQGS